MLAAFSLGDKPGTAAEHGGLGTPAATAGTAQQAQQAQQGDVARQGGAAQQGEQDQQREARQPAAGDGGGGGAARLRSGAQAAGLDAAPAAPAASEEATEMEVDGEGGRAGGAQGATASRATASRGTGGSSSDIEEVQPASQGEVYNPGGCCWCACLPDRCAAPASLGLPHREVHCAALPACLATDLTQARREGQGSRGRAWELVNAAAGLAVGWVRGWVAHSSSRAPNLGRGVQRIPLRHCRAAAVKLAREMATPEDYTTYYQQFQASAAGPRDRLLVTGAPGFEPAWQGPQDSAGCCRPKILQDAAGRRFCRILPAQP